MRAQLSYHGCAFEVGFTKTTHDNIVHDKYWASIKSNAYNILSKQVQF